MALVMTTSVGALSQELSPSHIAAAERVMVVTPSIGNLDALLPHMAGQVQDRLIRVRPDLFREIGQAVDGQALELSRRRTDLDNDIARIWARHFNEADLAVIEKFFGSEVGTKYKEIAPEIGQDILNSSQGWTNRVQEELYERSVEELARLGHDL